MRPTDYISLADLDKAAKAVDAHGRYVLIVSDRIAGRFRTKAGAEAEEDRLCRLALKNGHAITTRIRWEPPMPQTEQEAGEAALDATLY
jgi:hypothetical protein